MVSFAEYSKIAVEAIFYSSLGFVAVVSLFWPWWKSQLGWTIAAKSLALGLAVFPAMLIYWFGHDVFTDSPWLKWASVTMLYLIPPILIWRAFILFRIQQRSRALEEGEMALHRHREIDTDPDGPRVPQPPV